MAKRDRGDEDVNKDNFMEEKEEEPQEPRFADAKKLATRKIAVAKRRNVGGAPRTNLVANEKLSSSFGAAVSSEASAASPFGGFSGFGSTKIDNNTSEPAAPKPFGGFSGFGKVSAPAPSVPSGGFKGFGVAPPASMKVGSEDVSPTPDSAFSFGAKAPTNPTPPTTSTGFTGVGVAAPTSTPSSTQAPVSTGFKGFGVPPPAAMKAVNNEPSTAPATFTFGAPAPTTASNSTTSTSTSTQAPISTGFKGFGAPSPAVSTSTPAPTSTGFKGFGVVNMNSSKAPETAFSVEKNNSTVPLSTTDSTPAKYTFGVTETTTPKPSTQATIPAPTLPSSGTSSAISTPFTFTVTKKPSSPPPSTMMNEETTKLTSTVPTFNLGVNQSALAIVPEDKAKAPVAALPITFDTNFFTNNINSKSGVTTTSAVAANRPSAFAPKAASVSQTNSMDVSMDVVCTPSNDISSKLEFTATPSNDWFSEYEKEMATLNANFITWTKKWLDQSSYADLTQGMTEYIRFRNALADKLSATNLGAFTTAKNFVSSNKETVPSAPTSFKAPFSSVPAPATKPADAPVYTFGVPTPPTKPAEKVKKADMVPPPTAPVYTFGVPTPASEPAEKAEKTAVVPPALPITKFSFGTSPPTVKTTETTIDTTPKFSFGVTPPTIKSTETKPDAIPKPPVSKFSFGVPTEAKDSVIPIKPFTFGSSQPNSAIASPLVGSPIPKPFGGFPGLGTTTHKENTTGGFTGFGAKPLGNSSTESVPSTFSFGTDSSAPVKAPAFNFGGASTAPGVPKFGGFQGIASLSQGTNSPAESTEANNSGEEEQEEEEEEKEREAAGEEEEENVFSTRSRLYEYKKDSESWKEMGIGELRINKYVTGASQGKYRILLRPDSAAGIMVLNTFFSPIFRPTKVAKNSLTINVPFKDEASDKTELKRILIKVKLPEDLTKLDAALNEGLNA